MMMVKLFLNCNSLCWSLTDTLFVYFWHLFVYALLNRVYPAAPRNPGCIYDGFVEFGVQLGFDNHNVPLDLLAEKTDFNTARSNIFHGNVLFTIAHLIVSKEFSLSFFTPYTFCDWQTPVALFANKNTRSRFFIITGTILDIRKE